MRRILAVAAVAFVVLACGSSIGSTVIPDQPLVECVGVPPETCRQSLADARRNAAPGTVVVQIRVVCTKLPCTLQNGEAKVDVLYSNGRTESFGTGWAAAAPMPAGPPQPAPALPVEPTCLGVPVVGDAGNCHDFATSAMDGVLDGREVVSIVVRCKPDPCTPTNGAGKTILTFADGTTHTSEWSYQSGS